MYALYRYLRWQIASRLLNAPVAIPFVNETRLLIGTGMTGATGNLYAGLHEVAEMAFLLHLLRAGDDFIDIGANVGSYTVLAAGVVSARCLSIEPVPKTYEFLLDNIHLNRLESNVCALNIGLAESTGELWFTRNLDTVNHVIDEKAKEPPNCIRVQVESLETVAAGYNPVFIKIDVEGYEYPVLKGGNSVFEKPNLLAVALETNGSGERYGFTDSSVHAFMKVYGFEAARYNPFSRKLEAMEADQLQCGNTLYVKNIDLIRKRIDSAPWFQLGNGAVI
ncbi:MAG: FkbM family methyltransferase [Gammaproteobacteria bacterium]